MTNAKKLEQYIIAPARTNQFRVTVNTPPALNVEGRRIEQAQVLAQSVNIPESEIEAIQIAKAGKTISFAGDRNYPDISITYRVDLNYEVHNLFLNWSNYIVGIDNFGAEMPFQNYTADILIEALRKSSSDDVIITSEWNIRDAWPKSISGIELDENSQSEYVQFTTTFAIRDYTYRRISKV